MGFGMSHAKAAGKQSILVPKTVIYPLQLLPASSPKAPCDDRSDASL